MAVKRASSSALSAPALTRALAAGKVGASGGTVIDSGGYRIHDFTTTGTLSVSNGGLIEFLVVGGGGSGGQGSGNPPVYGGGGGAGGYIAGSMQIVGSTAYTITVGTAANPSSLGSLIVATRGGPGGGPGVAGTPGGSGGGGGAGANVAGRPGGAGSVGQGVTGNTGGASNPGMGIPGPGGPGGGVATSNSITGTAITYSSGGTTSGTRTTYPANTGGGGYGDAPSPATAGTAGRVVVRYLL